MQGTAGPRRTTAHAFLIFLAVIATSQLASGNRAAHPHGHTVRMVSQVPSCRAILDKLPDQQFTALRDSAQLHAQHTRKHMHWSMLLSHKGQTMDIGHQYAYNTSLSAAELGQLVQQEEKMREFINDKTRVLIDDLKREGLLPQDATLEKVRTCIYGRVNTHLFEYRPKVSIMMQYFKRPWNIQEYIARITACAAATPMELLVNVDHPQDHEAWAWASYNTSGLVVPVFSNNVHEVRGYNRIAHMARGDYLVLVGDDDLPPQDCTWLTNVVKVFDKWPEIGVLGIRGKTACFDLDIKNGGEWFTDPGLDIPLQFVEKVDMAPLAIRKSAYMFIGGFDESLTEPGECGILTDWDICYRMWVSGWQVAATKQTQMAHDNHAGGTHRPETTERCWGKQQGIAGQTMAQRINVDLERELCNVARELTLTHLHQIDKDKCPYTQGCVLQTPATSKAHRSLRVSRKAGKHALH